MYVCVVFTVMYGYKNNIVAINVSTFALEWVAGKKAPGKKPPGRK